MAFTILFNLLEITFIYLFGRFIDIQTNMIVMIMMIFFITRMTFKSPLHYNKWYICALWSFNVFAFLFVLLKVDIYICILSTVFTGYITSGKSNIEDMFMFKKGKPSKYVKLDEFIQYKYNDQRLIDYENYLKQHDLLMYNIYYLRFRQKCSFEEIKEKTNIHDQKRIVQILDNIYETLKYNLLLE